MQLLLTAKIGGSRVLSTQSKTKVSVGHAGLFQLLPQSKVPIFSKQVTWSSCLSNNLSAVIETEKMKVVTGDTNTLLSNTLWKTLLFFCLITLTPPRMMLVHMTKRKGLSLWLIISTYHQTVPINWELLLASNQLVWPSTLVIHTSTRTREVSWTPATVAMTLIMPSPLLVTALKTVYTTPLFETHGEQLGVKQATSEWASTLVATVFVVYLMIQSGHTQIESIMKFSNLLKNLNF